MSSGVEDSDGNDFGLSAEEDTSLLSIDHVSTSRQRRIGSRSYIALVGLLAVVLLAGYFATKKSTKEQTNEHEAINNFVSLDAVTPVSNPAFKGPPLLPGHCVLLAPAKAGDQILEATYAADFAVYDYIYIGNNKGSRTFNWRRIEGLHPLRLDIPLDLNFPTGTRCDKVILPYATQVYTTTVAPVTSMMGGKPCAQQTAAPVTTVVTATTTQQPIVVSKPIPKWYRWACAEFTEQQCLAVGKQKVPDFKLMDYIAEHPDFCSAKKDAQKGTEACCCREKIETIQDLKYQSIPVNVVRPIARQLLQGQNGVDQVIALVDISTFTHKYYIGQKIAVQDFTMGNDPQVATITAKSKYGSPHLGPNNMWTVQQHLISFSPPLATTIPKGHYVAIFALKEVLAKDVTSAMLPSHAELGKENHQGGAIHHHRADGEAANAVCVAYTTARSDTNTKVLTVNNDLGFVSGGVLKIGTDFIGEPNMPIADVDTDHFTTITLLSPIKDSDGYPHGTMVTCEGTCASFMHHCDPHTSNSKYKGFNTSRAAAKFDTVIPPNVPKNDETKGAYCCVKN